MPLILLVLLSIVCYCAYNVLFHPLSQFSGPFLYKLFPLPVIYLSFTGKLARRLDELHQKYGPVVRIAPNELSFISAQAWSDIYGHLHGKRQLPRDPVQYPHDIGGILLLDDQEHAQHRKLLAGQFSQRSMEQIQGPKIAKLIDLMIERLKKEVEKGNKTQEMGAWSTWLAFDVAGEITFSQSFNSIFNMKWSPWMVEVTQAVLQSIVANQLDRFGIITLLKRWAPQLFLEKERMIKGFVTDRVEERLQAYKTGNDTNLDVCTTLYEANESKQMINEDCFSFVLAGAITTTATLTAATWFMLNSPTTYLKAREEVRNAYKVDKDITMGSTRELRFLQAIIQETLRIFPAVPLGNSRIVPAGGARIIDGHYVPEGTAVSVCSSASFLSAQNWTRPREFLPERWLEEYKDEFINDNHSAFKPFSHGPRDCIGRRVAETELRLALAKLLWNFDLSLSEGMQNWPDRCKPFIIWDRAPMLFQLERRAVNIMT